MEATQKPRLFVAAFLACITLFATRSSTADAKDTGGNVVSYQCDIANDKLIVSYNTPLDGSAIDYNMDALIGSDGPNFVLFEDVTKSCILKSGLYLVVIHSSGWPNVQGECGGERAYRWRDHQSRQKTISSS